VSYIDKDHETESIYLKIIIQKIWDIIDPRGQNIKLQQIYSHLNSMACVAIIGD
jgi:hypothetical protein